MNEPARMIRERMNKELEANTPEALCLRQLRRLKSSQTVL